MRLTFLVLLVFSLFALGCGRMSELWSEALETANPSSAERPEGWESLEGSAMRLYYQYVDENQQVRFVETLEEVPESLRASVGFVKLDVPPPLSPGAAAAVRRAQYAGSAKTQRGAEKDIQKIVLYSADWCGACRSAKRYLARLGVDYELRDVDEPQYAEELKRRTGARSIPVIDVDGRMLTGFSSASYDKLIDRA